MKQSALAKEFELEQLLYGGPGNLRICFHHFKCRFDFPGFERLKFLGFEIEMLPEFF